MAYKAGSAFITVAPSFRGFHEKIRTETKGIGPIVIGVDADLTGLRTKLDAATRKRTAAVQATLDDATAKGRLDALGRNREVKINANADTGAAMSKLGALDALAKRMDGKTITMKASLLTAGGLASLPALAAGAGALGGVAALGGAAVAGVGAAAAIGTASIKQALDLQKKLTAAEKTRASALAGVKSAEHSLASAVSSASQAQVAAARGVQDAEQAVADARRNQARVADQSARAVKSAEASVAEAEYGVKQALDAVHQARLQAAADIADLQRKQGADARTVEGAQIALIEAQQRLEQVQKTSAAGSLELRKAQLDVANASADLSDAQRQQKTDQQALTKAQKDGIDGSKGVVSANHDLSEAQKQAKDAQTALAQAQKDGAQARADAARSVARAETALSRARADGASSVAQAQAQVADAQRRLALAQDKVSAADTKRLAILAKMGPMQDKIIAGVKALSLAWDKLVFSKPVTGAALSGLGAAQAALPGLSNFVKPVAKATGSALGDAGKALASPGAKQFASTAGVFTGKVVKDAEKGTASLAIAFGNLFKAFMPMALGMSRGLVNLLNRFANWSKGLDKNKGFQGFLAFTRDEGPKVIQFFGDLFKLAGKLIEAVTPLGAVLFTVISGIVGFLSKLSPGQLLAIAGGLVALFVAFRVGLIAVRIATLEQATAMGVLNVIMDANPIGLVVIAIAALAAGFIYAYKHSETFRTIVDGVFSWLKGAVTTVIRFVGNHWRLILSILIGPIGAAALYIITHWRTIKSAFSSAIDWVQGTFSAGWAAVRGFIVTPVRNAVNAIGDLFGKGGPLRTAFSNAVTAIGNIWDGLKALAAKPVNFIIDTVYNDGLRKALLLLPGINSKNLPKADDIKFATGGVLPGYTPGRDVHTFVSPTGGILHLSGGEAIMRPEWTRQVGGPAAVNRMNSDAAAGVSASFAGGGVLGKVSSYLNPATWMRGLQHMGGFGPLLSNIVGGLVDAVRSFAADKAKDLGKGLAILSPVGGLVSSLGGSTGGVIVAGRSSGYVPSNTAGVFSQSSRRTTTYDMGSQTSILHQGGGIQITVHDRSGDPVRTARETARQLAFAGGS